MGRSLLVGSLAALAVALVVVALTLSRGERAVPAAGAPQERVPEAPADAEVELAPLVREPERPETAEEVSREVVAAEEPGSLAAGTGRPTELQLEEGQALLTVQVRHERGTTPVRGARVSVTSESHGTVPHTLFVPENLGRVGVAPLTDEFGQAHFVLERGERYRIEATRDRRFGRQEYYVRRLGHPQVLDVELLELRSVRGVVIEFGTRRPIGGATVVALHKRSVLPTSETITARDGSFVCSFPSGYSPEVRAVKAGYGAAFADLLEGGDLVLELRPGGGLRLVVRDRGGAALAGMRVSLSTDSLVFQFPPSEERRMGPAESMAWGGRADVEFSGATDAAGALDLDGLPVEIPLLLVVSDGENTLHRDVIRMPTGRVHELELRVSRSGLITGRVTDPQGTPLAGLGLWLVADDGKDPLPREQRYFLGFELTFQSATAGADGEFSFEGVGDGDWWVGPKPALKPGPASFMPLAVLVHVERGRAKHVDLIASKGLEIEGTVVDTSGRAVTSGTVFGLIQAQQDPVQGRIESDGSFRIVQLPPGGVLLRAHGEDRYGPSASVLAYAGVRDVVLVLVEGASVRGRLVADDGSPVEGSIELVPEQQMEMDISLAAEGESFHFTSVRAGRYRLTARSVGRGLVITRLIDVEPGSDTDLGDVLLKTGATLVLRNAPGGPDRLFVVGPPARPIHTEFVEAGDSAEVLVPAGRVPVMEFEQDPSGQFQLGKTHDLRLEPGERRELGP